MNRLFFGGGERADRFIEQTDEEDFNSLHDLLHIRLIGKSEKNLS
jgi:hypothetical protein